jgi:hypothetical protein
LAEASLANRQLKKPGMAFQPADKEAAGAPALTDVVGFGRSGGDEYSEKNMFFLIFQIDR